MLQGITKHRMEALVEPSRPGDLPPGQRSQRPPRGMGDHGCLLRPGCRHAPAGPTAALTLAMGCTLGFGIFKKAKAMGLD